jgi:hypothetical protein
MAILCCVAKKAASAAQNLIFYMIFVILYFKCMLSRRLKVPKCENFHCTDFFYCYTIKPLWVGDFRAKIKNSKFLYLGGLFGVSFSKILCSAQPA